MKKLFTLLFLYTTIILNAQIATWNSTTGSPGLVATVGTATLGAGLFQTSVAACGNNVFTTNEIFDTGNPNPTTYSDAVTDNEYIEFPITANSGYSLTINQVSFSGQKSDTGGNNTGISNNTSLINETSWSPTSCGTRTITISPAIVINSGNTVYFRLYVWGATGSTGSWRIGSVIFSGTALPVQFSSFKIIKKEFTSNLMFSTSSETNNSHFTIERSSDGRHFDAIGNLAGAGNSSQNIDYTFVDTAPIPGINYYRIKQTDFDGKYSYSDIISTLHRRESNFSVSPQKTDGRLYIATNITFYTLEVISTSGQLVKVYPNMSDNQNISIEDLHQGLYFVRIRSGKEVEVIKVLKI